MESVEIYRGLTISNTVRPLTEISTSYKVIKFHIQKLEMGAGTHLIFLMMNPGKSALLKTLHFVTIIDCCEKVMTSTSLKILTHKLQYFNNP